MDNNQGFSAPAPAAPKDNSRRDMMIIGVILLVLCCLVVFGGAAGYFIWQESEKRAAADAQSTAIAQEEALREAANQATQTAIVESANATATALAQVETADFFEEFDTNWNAWRVGEEDNEFWRGRTAIENGVYVWETTETLQTFIAWGAANNEDPEIYSDFTASVDGRLEEGDVENFCYGLIFREHPDGLSSGGYVYTVCEDTYINLSYYSDATDWIELVEWQESSAVRPGDWNKIGVEAVGSEMTLFINDVQVAQASDSRQLTGFVSVLINVYEVVPGTVWFDNFSVTNR